MWSLIIGVPMLVVWVFGCPILTLIILIKNRKDLEGTFMKRYFLILYQGLKEKAFYWEFINILRKVAMFISNVLLSTFNGFYRAIVAITFLVFLLRLQI